MKKIYSILISILVIAPCMFFLTACGEPQKYNIEVRTSDASYGSVNTIDGSYDEGTSLTLRATPILDSEFLCWALNDTVVSKDAEYTISVSKETQGKYVAIFNNGCQYYAVSEVKFDKNGNENPIPIKLNIEI